jgi:hypothetical protein
METKNLSEKELEQNCPDSNSEHKEIQEPNNLIKTELLNTLDKFVNELDIAFDYVTKDTILQIKKYIKKLKEDDEELKSLVDDILEKFKSCESKLAYLSLSNGKIKTKEFDILNDKTVFGNLLNLSLFKEENKNTKKIISKYIYNMYMSSVILKFSFSDNLSLDSLNNELSKYFNIIKEQHSQQNNTDQQNNTVEQGGSDGNKKKSIRRLPKANPDMTNLTNLEGMDDIMNSLFANKDLVNIASEFTADIQRQNINPMTMLGSLMSGKPDKKITDLINQISGKLERKLNSGELDKEVFEQQASDLMNTLKTSNITSQLPVLNTILENSNITNIRKFK